MVVSWDGEPINVLSKRLVIFSGDVNDDLDFEYINGADVNVGCGAVLMGEYWYFGGEANPRQV